MSARTPAAAIAYGRERTKSGPNPDVTGMCLREIRSLYRVSARHPDAATAFRATRKRGKGPAPAGALHWWLGGANGYGHVALGVSRTRVISTDNVRRGALDVVTLARIERTWPALDYAGWSRDINGVTVLPLVRLRDATTVPAAVRILARALAEEGLLPERQVGATWTREILVAYSRWQERAGYGKATPGKPGPSDGLPGVKSLVALGLRRGFAATT